MISYVFFFVRLADLPLDDLSHLEIFLHRSLATEDLSFFPHLKALRLSTTDAAASREQEREATSLRLLRSIAAHLQEEKVLPSPPSSSLHRWDTSWWTLEEERDKVERQAKQDDWVRRLRAQPPSGSKKRLASKRPAASASPPSASLDDAVFAKGARGYHSITLKRFY